MAGFLRRNWVQVAGVATGLALVSVLAVVAFRPSATVVVKGTAVHSTTRRSAQATPDPREQVKTVARAFIQAFWDSAKTGKPDAADSFVEPDTQAGGAAGINVVDSVQGHENFMASRVDFIDTSWQVQLAIRHAHVEVDYRLFGHEADWPSRSPRESDHETKVIHYKFDMELVGDKWLIYQFN